MFGVTSILGTQQITQTTRDEFKRCDNFLFLTQQIYRNVVVCVHNDSQ